MKSVYPEFVFLWGMVFRWLLENCNTKTKTVFPSNYINFFVVRTTLHCVSPSNLEGAQKRSLKTQKQRENTENKLKKMKDLVAASQIRNWGNELMGVRKPNGKHVDIPFIN